MALHKKFDLTLKSELQVTELTVSIELNELLSKIDQISKNEYVKSSPRPFFGRQLTVQFYPKGDDRSAPNATAIYVRLAKADKPEHETVPLTVNVEIRCGSKRRHLQNSIEQFEKGFGIDFLVLTYLQKYPKITLFAKISNVAVRHDHNNDFFAMCKKMSKLSQCEGDVTLQVNVANAKQNQEIDELELQPPAAKKRKLNRDPKVRRSKRLQHSRSQTVEASLSDDEREEGVEGGKSAKSSTATQAFEVRVSSLLLKAASPVFKRMLESCMLESREKKITVHSGSVGAVNDMLYFLWTNQFKISPKTNAFDILRLAHFYEIERMKIEIVNHIIGELCAETFVDVVNLFDQYSIKDGMNALLCFAEKNRAKIIADCNCQELPFMFQMGVLKMGN